jgi:hypothetical protein
MSHAADFYPMQAFSTMHSTSRKTNPIVELDCKKRIRRISGERLNDHQPGGAYMLARKISLLAVISFGVTAFALPTPVKAGSASDNAYYAHQEWLKAEKYRQEERDRERNAAAAIEAARHADALRQQQIKENREYNDKVERQKLEAQKYANEKEAQKLQAQEDARKQAAIKAENEKIARDAETARLGNVVYQRKLDTQKADNLAEQQRLQRIKDGQKR